MGAKEVRDYSLSHITRVWPGLGQHQSNMTASLSSKTNGHFEIHSGLYNAHNHTNAFEEDGTLI